MALGVFDPVSHLPPIGEADSNGARAGNNPKAFSRLLINPSLGDHSPSRRMMTETQLRLV